MTNPSGKTVMSLVPSAAPTSISSNLPVPSGKRAANLAGTAPRSSGKSPGSAPRCRSSSGLVGEGFLALGPAVFTGKIAHHGIVTVRRVGSLAVAAPRALRNTTALMIVAGWGLAACHGGSSKQSASSSTVPAAVTSSTAGTTTTVPTSGYRHLDVAPPAASPSCAVAITERDPARLVAALRAARLRGSSAESCFTRQALALYHDAACRLEDLGASPGPIVLYACAGHTVTAIPDVSIEYVPGEPVLIQADIDLAGQNEFGHPIRLPEHLTIGPGTTSDGHAAAQVITDTTSI